MGLPRPVRLTLLPDSLHTGKCMRMTCKGGVSTWSASTLYGKTHSSTVGLHCQERHRTELMILALAGLAGKYAADANDAEIVDPREYYQGSLRRTLKKYPHIGKTIPAMGYSAQQVCAS